MIAANVAMVAEVVKISPDPDRAKLIAGLMLATNAVLCFILGIGFRFRLIPLMGIFTTAALTEALLLGAAASRQNNAWILVVAMLGAILLAWIMVRLRAATRRR
jgi:hypothetical protein